MEHVTTCAKKVKTPWPTFRFSGSSTPITWARTFIFGRMADVRQALHGCSLCFWPTLTYFFRWDNNGLWPPSAYTAVVRLRAPAAFLVCCWIWHSRLSKPTVPHSATKMDFGNMWFHAISHFRPEVWSHYYHRCLTHVTHGRVTERRRWFVCEVHGALLCSCVFQMCTAWTTREHSHIHVGDFVETAARKLINTKQTAAQRRRTSQIAFNTACWGRSCHRRCSHYFVFIL